jgi:hypothetical protein
VCVCAFERQPLFYLKVAERSDCGGVAILQDAAGQGSCGSVTSASVR